MNHPTNEARAGGLISWRYIIFILVIVIVIGIIGSSNLFPMCTGEPKSFKRSGLLKDIFVENDLCCHCYARIEFYNQSIIRTVDCNEDLMDIPVGRVYTFYFKPYPEPYAATTGCFWDNIVDYVENENGVRIYG